MAEVTYFCRLLLLTRASRRGSRSNASIQTLR